MSDEYILDDVVETFSDEDTLMSDIRNNPVKWLLSLAVVGPGMAYTMTEQTSYASAMENWGLPTGLEWILAIFVTGQLLIAPLSCYLLDRTGNMASGLFIAMGGSAILVANPGEIAQFSEAFGWPFFLFCVALCAPMLLVLKNKKKLLDPGKERLTWCTLLSTAIMVYTVAAIVPSAGVALIDVSCEEDAGALLSEVDVLAGATDACEALQYRYVPILGMAAAVGWAWPRGKKIIDDLSDDFLDGLKDIGPGGGDDGNNDGSLVGSTFRIGRKAVTTVIALGLLAVIASEGYAIYDTSQSNSESYFAFDWTSGYDNESKVFSASSPLFVENPGVIPKEANIAVTISMTCEENEVIAQSDHDYSLGEEVTLEFEADVPQPMADCIDEGNDLMIDITGTVGLMVFGFEAVETDIPAISFECSKDTEEGEGEPTLQGCVAWPKSSSL